MTYFLSLVLILINSLFAFGRKNSKIFCILLVSFMWVIFWGNLKNPDYTAYMNSYNSIGLYGTDVISTTGSEIGFRYLIKLIFYFNIDYNGFLLIISLIGFLLINSTIKKYTSNNNYVYLLYFVYPFFIDIIQIRNFMAMSIIIFSIRYLLSQRKKDKIKYIIAVLLSMTIHYTAFMYLPLIFISKKSKSKMIKLIVCFSTLGCIFMIFVNNSMSKVANIIYALLGSDKYKVYFMSKTRYGYLLFFGIQIMSFFMISIAKKNWNTNQQSKDCTEDNAENDKLQYENYSFVEFVYWINIYAFSFLPFYILNSNFTRLMRNLQLLYFVAFSITSDSFSKDSGGKVLFNILVVIYVLAMFFINIYIPAKDDIFHDILRNNLLF